MSELTEIRVLLIEPHSGMRASIHNMLNLCGVTRIEHGISSGTGLSSIKAKYFDLILCEYELGAGQDGQQLLEDIRHHKLAPLSTIFIMVTAERSYEKVVSAAELAPNDYLLKPFTPDGLLDRITRALKKRANFMRIYQLMDNGNYPGAIAECIESEERHERDRVDFMRLRAELHILMGEPELAEPVYKQLTEMRTVAWARLGLAKSMHLQGRYEEAGDILKTLVVENDRYMDAFDLLAKNHEETGQLESAKNVLSAAVEISPHGVRRLRKLGEIALSTGDFSCAELNLKKVVSKVKYSDFKDPEDHVNLVQALVQTGNIDQAKSVIRDLEKTMPDKLKTAACRAISTAFIHAKNNDPRLAEELINAVAASRENIGLSTSMKLGLAKNCLDSNMHEEASEVILEVMRNSTNSNEMQRAIGVFESAGQGELGNKLANQSRAEVMELVAAGVQKAKIGDYRGSVELMSAAVKQLPNNPQVVMNAALAYLKYLENHGWEQKLAEQARRLIDASCRLDPANARNAALRKLYEELQKKYGISRG
ncbi:tetratricopeptide repeat-containing response regulator [Solimicrobium silvestre]|uniref:Response regulator receiver domain n=1 Tax=Solimicrobium silvestre TaxID=2099400 RepID=A0A2S9H480_9BURK|nr:tetratricopeptide repeat-containing response regulator [Solimicrobium silvestre]PRC94761.1 Response regulator receiver domain [Solimicrobium silvestre]